MKPEQERIRSLLVDTMCLLCRNGLNFENELKVQAVIGITVDKEECFVVHVNKCFERKTLQEDEESCESEEQLQESLQQLELKSKETELQLSKSAIHSATAVMQPTCDDPPSPPAESQHSIKKPSLSQDLSASDSCQQQVSARDNCTSTSDIHIAQSGSSKHRLFDDCAEFNVSSAHGKMSRSPVPVESDECDESSVATTDSMLCLQNNVTVEMSKQPDMYGASSQPTRHKLRHSVDAYRPKTKKRNLCEDLFDAEDDYCSEFTVGQQYMYIDSGKSRPKVPKRQKQDVIFNPHCAPSMMGYGIQDVR